MALTKICDTITLGSDWHDISLGSDNSFYMIAIKEDKGVKDTVDPEDVTKVIFELGIDGGLTTPLSIGYITLNFTEHTSSDAEIDKKTALTRVLNQPSAFKIRPSQVWTEKGLADKNTVTSISVNINTVKFN